MNHTITVAAAGTVSASLNWNTNADLDLLLLNSAGTTVASSTGTAKPQNLPATNVTAGTYTLRVVAAGGNPQQYPATYTLSVTNP